MTERLNIVRVSAIPPDFDELLAASLEERFFGLQRLRADWEQGANRFAELGEALFEARVGGRLVAVCGLNQDPYLDEHSARVARLRRLYVLPEHRRMGTGKALVRAVLQHASSQFRVVRLRTGRADADQFYVALGFRREADSEHSTHSIELATR